MVNLSEEQKLFISEALKGTNILVEACIGSGKTTSIQHLCNEIPKSKNVLYLTYNKLLKIDAKSKIKNANTFVTNYHGFAYYYLIKSGFKVARSDIIQRFLKEKILIKNFDVLIMDEYQDINKEISDMLVYIKKANPNLQIIAVGDMMQKIYDSTNLDVEKFISKFLGPHLEMEFTKCFRLNKDLSETLGNIWQKKIEGVNNNCRVSLMNKKDVVKFIAKSNISDILCLGMRNGYMADVLNELELKYPDKFNKNTVYASIREKDDLNPIDPKKGNAIFTTYDSSKGLEYHTCIIFDFDVYYWKMRLENPDQSYEILRNIFCVAASRGKENIIFVKNNEYKMLTERDLSSSVNKDKEKNRRPVAISEMFDYKFKESVDECFNLLTIKEIRSKEKIINIENKDGLIDLSPCIGIFQEANYFEKYNVDDDIDFFVSLHDSPHVNVKEIKKQSIENKILCLVSLETRQKRYIAQVKTPYVKKEEKNELDNRLSSIFSKYEDVQIPCVIDFSKYTKFNLIANGIIDVLKNNIVYELKFVSELKHEYFLQCACYVIAKGFKKGVLWNTRDNTMFEITIKSPKKFLKQVAKTVLKL